LHLALGDKENALAYLEQAVEAERSQNTPLINADPIYDPIRNEPRFVALIQKMGLQR
jgi:serine/threonine-protein kinase